MVQVLPNILLTASHTTTTPFAMDAAVLTQYLVKNKSADTQVLVRANIGASGVTKGAWVRVRPFGEGLISYPTGVAITQLELALHDSPRWASFSETGSVVRHAQSAQVEIGVH